jgi:hypothetical protein
MPVATDESLSGKQHSSIFQELLFLRVPSRCAQIISTRTNHGYNMFSAEGITDTKVKQIGAL